MATYQVKIEGWIHQYVADVDSTLSETPYFTFSPSKYDADSNWVELAPHTIELTLELDPKETVAKVVEAIDKEITARRLEVESDLARLRAKKQNFLAIAHTAP